LLNIFIKKVITRLTEHVGVITLLLRGAPRLGLASGPALARAGPADKQSRVKGCWGPQKKSRWGPLISASI